MQRSPNHRISSTVKFGGELCHSRCELYTNFVVCQKRTEVNNHKIFILLNWPENLLVNLINFQFFIPPKNIEINYLSALDHYNLMLGYKESNGSNLAFKL